MKTEELKTLPDSELVSQAVALDRGMKAGKRRLDAVKAEIQARGLRMIEDRNIHYIKYYSADGSAAVTDTQSLEVLNVDRLDFYRRTEPDHFAGAAAGRRMETERDGDNKDGL